VAANTTFTVPESDIRYCRESSPVGDVKVLVAP